MRPIILLSLLLLLLLPLPVHAGVLISEILVSNQEGLRDEDGDTSDWLELYNNCNEDVSIDGWFLSDDPQNSFKWVCPDITLGPGESLVVFASGKDRRDPDGELHTNFGMRREGEYLALTDAFGDVVSQFSPLYPEQQPDRSYGVRQISSLPGSVIQPSAREFFATPSPWTFNGVGLAGFVPEPTVSVSGGLYSTSRTVIVTPAPGTSVHYTLDGSEPALSSSIPIGPIVIPAATTELRVKGFAPQWFPSKTVSYGYVQMDPALHSFDTNVPIIVIDTFGQPIPQISAFGKEDIPFVPAFMRIVEPNESGRAFMSAASSFAGRCGVKPRGSSTAGRRKASLSVEIWDGHDEDRDVSLLGMPAESDWVLQGPLEFDRAMMRNPFIYNLGRQMGHASPRVRIVEVFLNTTGGRIRGPAPGGDYFGVYFLVEKIKRGEDRVDVARMYPSDVSEPEVSGGYIFKIDRTDPGDAGFSGGGQGFQWVYPKEENTVAAQRSWLTNHLNQFRSALDRSSFTDPDIGYPKYINRESWIDSHIIHQFANEPDGFGYSTYLFKDRDGKIELGPLWDFDRTMGSDFDLRSANTAGWFGRMFGHSWWNRLFQDPDFWVAWRDRWHEVRQGALSDENMSAMIDGMAVELGEAYVRNYTRWRAGSQMGPSGWPVEVEQLRQWQVDRVAWMDSQMPETPTLSHASRFVESGFELEMSAPAGSVFYTRDGTDPRLPGGGVSPVAFEFGVDSNLETILSTDDHLGVQFFVPQDDSLGTGWTARLFDDSSWQLSIFGIGLGYENSSGYEFMIDVDIGAQMFNQRSSVYLRYEFKVTNPSRFQVLRLLMKYDDAFVAYLNGQQVAASPNAPQPALWNSTDFPHHEDVDAVNFEAFDIPAHIGALVSGTNVLAIHGLNRSIDSSDLIFVPELRAGEEPESSSTHLVLNESADIRARVRNGSEWSAVVGATFVVGSVEGLRVTEIQYHPTDPPPESPYDDNDFEFIEMQNSGSQALNLTGIRLRGGVEFDFADGEIVEIGPGEYVVLVRNLEAFKTRYSTTGINIAGEYDGSLENQGEALRLEDLFGETIQEFEYDDLWYPETDGGGHSLVIADPRAEPEAWSTQEGWRASIFAFGTPGRHVFVGGGLQIPGDASQNSVVDLADAVALLFMLFAGRPSPCEGATAADGGNVALLDANGDGQVDGGDAVYTLTYLYLAGPPHVRGTRCYQIGGCATKCAP